MNNSNLKVLIIFLILFTGKITTLQAFNANFGYTVNCRTITLSDSSTGTGNQYFWSFGDGNYANTSNPQHTYHINGNYNVTLVIICYDSSSVNFLKHDTMMKQITINCSTCNIKAEFSAMRDPVIDKKMIFTNHTAGQTNYAVSWNFGYTGNGGSSDIHPVHTFPNSGYYYVKLVSYYFDSGIMNYCYDSIAKEVLVNKLRAKFGYTLDTVDCTTVYFTDSSTGNPDYQYWDFGDNIMASSFNPVHTYTIGTGTDTQVVYVRLSIYSYDSSTSTYYGDTIEQQIILPPCNICQINASIDLGGDSTIAYAGLLYNYSSGTINKHYWDFGDGGTSTSNAPVHSYANPGKYTITYIASDTIKNCTDTAWVSFTIDSAGFLKRQAFILTVIDKTSGGSTKVNAPKNSSIKIFPNPASSLINIEINDESGYSTLTIINNIGQIVYSGPISPLLDLSNFAKGIYTLKLSGDQEIFISRIIKE